MYYIYESGGNVYYEGDKVFVDGVATNPDDYFESVQNQANGVPDFSEQEAEDAKWLPLGVFAISESDVAATTMLIQLAVSDGGVVAGTFFNESTGKTIPIEGLVDEETQRVAFKAADGSNDNLVLETGIYNLTQETAPVLVHFGPEQTQTWTLVRLEDDSVQEPSE